MTVEERIRTILLIQKMDRNKEAANRLGLRNKTQINFEKFKINNNKNHLMK